MNKEFYKTQTSIAAIIIIIGFALPWVSLGPFGSITGFDIPKVAEFLSGMSKSFSNNDVSSGTQIYYILYLIPLLSAYLIYGEYKGITNFFAITKVIILLLCAFIVYKLTTLGKNTSIFEKAGFGLWISCAGSLFLVLQIVREFFLKTPGIVEDSPIIDSRTPSKIMFDLSSKQARAKKSFKMSTKAVKIVAIVVAIIGLFIGLYILLHKNSYQQVLVSLENRNWELLNYYYEKAHSEILNGELELDYDENKTLEVAYGISDKMLKHENFRKKLSLANSNDLQTYFDLDEDWTMLPSINNKTVVVEAIGIDASNIYKPAIAFSDSFNIAFAEQLIPDSSLQKIRDGKVQFDEDYLTTTYQNLNQNINILLNRIIDKGNDETNLRVKKIKNKLLEIEDLASAIGGHSIPEKDDFIGEFTPQVTTDGYYEKIVIDKKNGENVGFYVYSNHIDAMLPPEGKCKLKQFNINENTGEISFEILIVNDRDIIQNDRYIGNLVVINDSIKLILNKNDWGNVKWIKNTQ